MPKRILCILGSKHLYGKERSNIEVYNLLQNQGDYVLKVLSNKGASRELKEYLGTFDTVWSEFPDRSETRFKYLKYLLASLRLNLKVLFILLKFSPHYIFMNEERVFYDMCLPIYFARSKVIYRIGDAPAFPKLKNFKINAWVWKHIVLEKTERFVYISDYIKNSVSATGRNSGNDLVIYNYPPGRRASHEPPLVSYNHKQRMAVGYLGQIIPEKGVHLFVDAAIELLNGQNGMIFFIAGDLDYSKEYADQLNKEVRENRLEDHIIFLGGIDNVEDFFDTIDVLVTPSIKQEPLGNVIVEAKKFGTPSIIFPSGGMPELISHKTNGFVCDRPTASQIVKGVEYYLKNPGLIELHGKNAKASIKELKINYANFKKKWLQVFVGN